MVLVERLSRMTKPPPTKPDIRTAFLDAAERLLIEEGRDGISTRRLAREAGLNHGLVHYYFGTVDNLVLAVFERFTDRLAEQRAMYAADVPFLESGTGRWASWTRSSQTPSPTLRRSTA